MFFRRIIIIDDTIDLLANIMIFIAAIVLWFANVMVLESFGIQWNWCIYVSIYLTNLLVFWFALNIN